MLDTTDRSPAQMAAELTSQFPLSPDAPLAIAESHRDESIKRRKPDLTTYWAEVADRLATVSQR